MSGFDPHDRRMSRSRGQLLYRYRPQQTFDHPGHYTAQVRHYGADAGRNGDLDERHLVREAIRLVRRWREEGIGADGAAAASDRAPEFPEESPAAEERYEVVVPSRVLSVVWPRSIRCARCHRVWAAADPMDNPAATWPPRCPTCHNADGNRQLQFVFVHQCGEVRPFPPPQRCDRGHEAGFRLNDTASRFTDFRWECMQCRLIRPVMAFCGNPSCAWSNKMMAPQLHTASSAYVGQGVSLVNPPTSEFARLSGTADFRIATLGLWLGLCDEDEADRLKRGAAARVHVSQEVLDSITALESSGVPSLIEQGRKLRESVTPLSLQTLSGAVADVLGFDPLVDGRGAALASGLELYQRVRQMDRIDLGDLERMASGDARRVTYSRYPSALEAAGFDPAAMALVTDFPVTYLAVGYSRGGFGPPEADLVPYRGRSRQGQLIKTLIYANPTDTEALVFHLDIDRVRRWLIANRAASAHELDGRGGVRAWLAAVLADYDGRPPLDWSSDTAPRLGDPGFGARALFGLLHSLSHQVLRGLAVHSGHSETGLSEYLFPLDLAFAVYPNGGSEFIIGGLRTVLEQNLDEVVARAVDNTACIYDPHCMISNEGSDHGCLQLPETACQLWNHHLSRWYLFGYPAAGWTGYWSPALEADVAEATDV